MKKALSILVCGVLLACLGCFLGACSSSNSITPEEYRKTILEECKVISAAQSKEVQEFQKLLNSAFSSGDPSAFISANNEGIEACSVIIALKPPAGYEDIQSAWTSYAEAKKETFDYFSSALEFSMSGNIQKGTAHIQELYADYLEFTGLVTDPSGSYSSFSSSFSSLDSSLMKNYNRVKVYL